MMKNTILAAILAVGLSVPGFGSPARSAEQGPVGYGGFKIQMQPIMAPYRTSQGVRYQVLTLRLLLSPNPETDRPACFMVPILHEKIVLYLYKANLTPADFSGQRLDVLRENLFKLIIDNSDRSYFTGLEFMDDQSMLSTTTKGKDGVEVKSNTDLDPRSQTLSSQCK